MATLGTAHPRPGVGISVHVLSEGLVGLGHKKVLYEYIPREMYSVRSHSLRAILAGMHPTRDTCRVRITSLEVLPRQKEAGPFCRTSSSVRL